MATGNELQDFKDELEKSLQGSIPINTSFKKDIAFALIKYKKAKGLPYVQDVIRIAVQNFLSKSGYLD